MCWYMRCIRTYRARRRRRVGVRDVAGHGRPVGGTDTSPPVISTIASQNAANRRSVVIGFDVRLVRHLHRPDAVVALAEEVGRGRQPGIVVGGELGRGDVGQAFVSCYSRRKRRGRRSDRRRPPPRLLGVEDTRRQPGVVTSPGSGTDLDQCVEEGGSHPVGQGVVGQGVDGATVGVLRRPPPRDRHDARPHPFADAGPG